MSDESDDYDVGYGKPPRHTQFKPGQSGNSKGRPRSTRNFKTDLREELEAEVVVNEGGRTQTISRQKAMIKRTVEKALKGDLRATQMLAQWVSMHLADDPTLLASEPLDKEDLALLARHGMTRDTGGHSKHDSDGEICDD
jgi:hypothetical protein